MTHVPEIHALGMEIDAAIKAGREDAFDALDRRCTDLLALDGADRASLHCFRANIAESRREVTNPASWAWRQPHLERAILYLRRARAEPSFDKLDPMRRAQIVTNLANMMNTLGRPFEAHRLYGEVFRHVPGFAMAVANRGLCRATLASLTEDDGHRAVIASFAQRDFERARSDEVVWDGPYPEMDALIEREIERLRHAVDADEVFARIELDGWDMGEGEELAFRERTLAMGLFLNPLSVLGAHSIAAIDPLHLPSHRYRQGEPPHYLAWFNHLKQEFITARLLYHEGMTGTSIDDVEEHFADRDVRLVASLNCPAYSIAVKKLRLSFRSAYGILDMIGGFLNLYFDLGRTPRRVDLRGIWYRDSRKRDALRPEFEARPNLPLRGLYWLSFDILGEAGGDDAIAPEAAHLSRMRNAMEHRCLVLTEEAFARDISTVDKEDLWTFQKHARRMLELVHEALLLLSLAVHVEERVRAQEGLVVDLHLPDLRRS